jgi:mono/diheme cytochrome c family protein
MGISDESKEKYMTRFLTTTLMMAAFAIGSVIPSVAFAAGDAAAGKAEFQKLCVSCHGEGGKGDGPTGKALAAAGQPAPRDFTVGDFVLDTDKDGKTGTDADLKNVITKGALVYGGSAMMAPIQGLSDADLDNMIAFIRSLKQ